MVITGGKMAGNKKVGNGLYQPMADINITPLVDVMLVLLIIFMVTAPMLAAGLKVSLPQARAAQKLDQKEPLVLHVTKEGRVSIGADEYPREGLVAALKARMGDDSGRMVHLKGDREVAYGEIVGLMDNLAAGGIVRIAIITDARARQPVAGSKP